VDKALNIIISGAIGASKSYMACALGSAACRLGYKVQCLHIARFLHSLNIARKDGSYLQLLQTLSKMYVLILDDRMCDPVPLTATQNLLELFDDRYAHASTVISTQVPISDWYARFPDPTLADAVLDRIVHSTFQLNLSGVSQIKLRGFRFMSHT
jgi:DNA replication protein DnaC